MTSTKLACPSTNGSDYYTLDKSQNICVHTSMKCSLNPHPVYNKNGVLMQPCYNADGTTNQHALPKPAAAGSNKINKDGAKPAKKMTMADKCASLTPFGTDLKDKNVLLNDIEDLHENEKNILEQIQMEVSPDGKVHDMVKVDNLMRMLKPIQSARMRLLEQLKYYSTSSECTLTTNKKAMEDQMAMVLLAEESLKSIEKQTEDLINKKNNKKRTIQITNYEYERYQSHADILKTVAFSFLFVLAGIFVNRMGFSMIGNALIVLAMGIGLIMISRTIYVNLQRSSMDWDRFDWDEHSVTAQKSQPSIIENDKHFLEHEYSRAKNVLGGLKTKITFETKKNGALSESFASF